jgi:hypothetical protein
VFNLGIEIKVREKNFKISLNLITVQIEDQILSEVWTRHANREGLQILPIHIGLKTPSGQYKRSNIPYSWKGGWARSP